MERSLGFVVKLAEMDHYASVGFNELLCIGSEIVELKRASKGATDPKFKQIISPNKQRLVSAFIRVACVNLSNMKPHTIPDQILEEFLRVI